MTFIKDTLFKTLNSVIVDVIKTQNPETKTLFRGAYTHLAGKEPNTA